MMTVADPAAHDDGRNAGKRIETDIIYCAFIEAVAIPPA